VIAQRRFAGDVHRLDLEAPWIARRAEPGQFVHLRPAWGTDPLLPRPFSVHRLRSASKEAAEGFSILYRVCGRGTSRMTRLRPGDGVQVLGPLGRGFSVDPFAGRSFLLAGGMGAAPLLFLAQRGLATGAFSRDRCELVYGARTGAELAALEAFEALGITVSTATDDGSRGFHGTATALLDRRMEQAEGPFRVFAVGPEAMYRALQDRLPAGGVRCEISVERRMACGLGVCRSCVLRVRGAGGEVAFRDACRTGPVFPLEAVCFDELA